VVPITDQQEGEQAGQFPEKGQHHQVAGHHHARHRAHESQHECVETRHRILGRQVIARIQSDQRADAEDQQAEQPGQPVHAQAERHADGGNPGDLFAQHLAAQQLRQGGQREAGAEEGDEAGQHRARIAGLGGQGGCGEAAGKGQDQESGQQHVGSGGGEGIGIGPHDAGSQLLACNKNPSANGVGAAVSITPP
jgi:hypothetical protein